MKTLKIFRVLSPVLVFALMSASCTFGLGVMDYDKATNLYTDRHTGVVYQCALGL